MKHSFSKLASHLYIYRDDENHPTISGNKFHKLLPNIQQAKAQGCKTLVSFGGYYSNHLHALAYAAKKESLDCVGFVRGELENELTATLHECRDWGMKLIAMSRSKYRSTMDRLASSGGGLTKEVLADFSDEIPTDSWVIPEGGSNTLAIESLAKAYKPLFEGQGFTHAVCATGTGATVAGLRKSAPKHLSVIGVQAVAEGEATIERIKLWLGDNFEQDFGQLNIVEGHLGGFAKMPKELLQFIDDFEQQNKIPLDPVYNGKLMYTLDKMFDAGELNANDKVLVIHTGGLQGKRGI